ncbi:MAG: zinc ribbon domain-containing protein [Humidesulfovibrio sp.]
MPIYEYACAKCGKVFEELVFSAADEAVVVCPACGAGEPRRCLSACAAVISGESGGAGAQASGGGCAAPSPGGFR